jgi:uncharacterized protein DUF6152
MKIHGGLADIGERPHDSRWRSQMKSKTLTFVILVAGLLAASGLLLAHHGTAAYDTSKSVTVKGTVTDFQFINPHVIVLLDVTDDKGTVQKWQGELTSPNHLVRAGWTKVSIKPGDQVTFTGYPAKSGANSLWITKTVLGNGEQLGTGGGN